MLLDHFAMQPLGFIMVQMKQTKALHFKRSDYTLSQPKALKVSARKHVQQNM